MISFSLFPLLTLGHYCLLLFSQTLRESKLLVPMLDQPSRSKGRQLILFTFFTYTDRQMVLQKSQILTLTMIADMSMYKKIK